MHYNNKASRNERVPLCCLVTVAGLWGVCASAIGQQLEPRASVALTNSDNAQRFSSGGASETVVDATAGVRYDKRGVRLDAYIDGELTHREYLDNTFDPETLPRLVANARYNVVPERLTWIVEDDYGQVATRPFDALSPSDRESTNLFETGPEIFVPLNARMGLGLTGLYNKTTFDVSDIDSDRYDGEASLQRRLSPSSVVSANYSYEKVKFEQSDLYPEFTIDAVFMRYALAADRTTLALEAGLETIEVGGESDSGPRFDLTVERWLNRYTWLSAGFNHGFSDASESFRSDIRGGLTPSDDENVVAVADPFESDRAYLMLTRELRRTVLEVEGSWNREQYQSVANLDREVYGAAFTMNYRMTNATQFIGRAEWSREVQEATQSTSRDLSYTVGFSRRMGRTLQLDLHGQHYRRTGDLDQFNENRITLIIAYSPGPVRARVYEGDRTERTESGSGSRNDMSRRPVMRPGSRPQH